ncbi:type 4b pilus protein PilO2 [Salmonella enterica]
MADKTCITLDIRGWRAVAGLNWREELTRSRRSLRALARSRGHTLFITLPDPEGTLSGSGSPDVSPGDRRGPLVSLARLVLPALGPETVAILPLENQLWFVATSQGRLSVFSDVFGNADQIRAALALFEQMTPVPEDGRSCYAPPGFLAGGVHDGALAQFLPPPPPVWTRLWPAALRSVRLLPVSTRSRMARLVTLGVLVTAGTLLWRWHTAQEEARLRVDQARARHARHVKPSVKPWTQQPALRDFLQQCAQLRHPLPLSVAAWQFSDVVCGADQQSGEPEILAFYARPAAGTVNDFYYRLPAFFPAARALFDIPGPGRTARFTLPLRALKPARGDTLPTADFAIRQLTSYAQVLHASVTIKPDDSHTVLPWQTLTFTFRTDFPPEMLFRPAQFRADGVRPEAMEETLSGARLHFTLKGKLYATR